MDEMKGYTFPFHIVKYLQANTQNTCVYIAVNVEIYYLGFHEFIYMYYKNVTASLKTFSYVKYRACKVRNNTGN